MGRYFLDIQYFYMQGRIWVSRRGPGFCCTEGPKRVSKKSPIVSQGGSRLKRTPKGFPK